MRVADYLDIAAERHPHAEALVFGAERLNYAETKRRVHAIASALKAEAGLGENAKVAVYSGNDHRVPLVQWGANRADMVWLGVHVRNATATNVEVLDYLDCDAIFFSSTFESAVPELKAGLPKVRLWVCLDRESAHGPCLETWVAGHAGEFPYTPCDNSRVALMIPSGGTTGPAKGAVHSHTSVEMEIVNLTMTMGIGAESRLLTVAPLSHAAGQIALAFVPFGAANVILADFEPGAFLRTCSEERISHLFLPPTLLYLLLIHPLAQTLDFSSLRCVFVGAAPVAPEKFKEAVRIFGPVVYEAYAQTETLIPVLVKSPSDYLRADGQFDEDVLRSSGRPPPFVRVAIMDDAGAVLPPGTAGEIVVRATMGMLGYYKLPDATAEASLHGWHHTGDVGVMDSRGYVTLIDRKKDMIISGGFNVYPNEVEAVLNTHAAVLECIVIGVPDDKWGEAVKGIVRLKPGAAVSDVELIALCRQHLGPVKAPKSVEFWPDLPRSAVGKLLRREARKPFWAGQWRSI
jgi:acyl-CoA synthetase (AMP-forming)/AMP-acid ligase II